MTDESTNPPFDSQLEARIVAFVLGEASDFEQAQLLRLIEQRADAAVFYHQTLQLHQLMEVVGAGEPDDVLADGDDEWRLPESKREALLAAFDGADETEPVRVDDNSEHVDSIVFQPIHPVRRKVIKAILSVAAAIIFVGMASSFALYRLLNQQMAMTASPKGADAKVAAGFELGDADEFGDFDGFQESKGAVVAAGKPIGAFYGGAVPSSGPVTMAEKASSTSALSTLKETLNAGSTNRTDYYFSDDVQYMPSDGPTLHFRRNDDLFGMQGGALGNDKSGVMSEVSRQLAQSQSGESEQSGRSRVTRFGGVAIAGDGDRQPQSSSRFNVVGDFAIDISRADRYREYAKGAPETPPPAPSVALGYSAAPTAPGQRGVEAGRPAVTAPGIDSSLGDSLAADAPAAESLGTVPMDLFSTRGFAPSPQMSDGVMRSAQGLIEDAITPGIVLGESEERFEGFDNKIAGVNNSNDHPFSDPNSKSDWGIAAGGESNGQADKNSNAWMYSDRDVRAKDKLQIAGSAGEKPLNRNQLWSEFDVAENSGLIPATPNSEPSIVAGRAPAANSIHDRRLPGDLSDESLPSLETERLSELAESQSTKSEQAEVALGLELPAGQPLVGSGLDVTLNKKLAEVPMLATPAQAEVQELNATDNAFSTFSLHVSDVSFQLAKSELENNAWPNPQQVRVEEFVNAFGYHDPLPRASERVACRIDQAIHPSMQQRNVLRLSMRTAAFGRAASTPLQLTVLLDHSGSMERSDRQQTLRAAFETLAQQLTPNDHVTLISFARQPRLVVDQLPGGQSEQLLEVLDQTPVQGGTNFEAAIELASQKASEHFDPNAQNRIVLMTDGAVNLGDADPLRLSNTIETLRDRGIAFDAAGIGADGLNDEVLESLTRKGDGRYYLLNSVAEADEAFAKQIAGSLRPFAKNVKVQVEFNPERVGQYKLLGFDEHRLNKEDFHNDAVDAAELTAEEAGVAVYQVEVKPNGSGDVGSVSVRFQDVATGRMVERRWPIPFDPMPSRLESADPAIKLATVAALFASKLKADPIGTTIDFATLKSYLNDLPSTFAAQPRVTQLQDMIGKAQQLTGN